MTKFPTAVTATALVVLAAAATTDARAADPAAGRRLANQWCSSCHIVGTETGGSDAAPPFEAVANDPEFTEDGLRAWLAAPHPPMPNLDLTRAEIADIVAYLQSLRRE